MTRTQKYLALRKAAIQSLESPDIEIDVFLGASGLKLTFRDCEPLKRTIQEDYASNILNHGFGLVTQTAFEEEEKVLIRCEFMLNKLGSRWWTERKD